MKKILIVDDDTAHRTMLKVNLLGAGYEIVEADDGDRVMPVLSEQEVDLVLMDLKMQRMDGIEAIKLLREKGRIEPVVVITAFSSVESAVEAMKYGAMDYVTKPVDIEALKLTVAKALDFEALREENLELKKRLGEQFDFGNIIGRSPAMQKVFETLSLVAPSDATVLINGASGTGKELIAGALHHNSNRKKGPFIKVNCAALHENLLESELFGHEKGAFTDAKYSQPGLVSEAAGGTLFLDEIDSMSAKAQVALLRFLQDHQYRPLGAKCFQQADVRIIAATNSDLAELVKQGAFREDLYFRINVMSVNIPPLRERIGDVHILAEHYLQSYREQYQEPDKYLSNKTLHWLDNYRWPGNVRELENILHRLFLLADGPVIHLEENHNEVKIERRHHPIDRRISGLLKMNFSEAKMQVIDEFEKKYLHWLMAETGGNVSHAARLAGKERRALGKLLKKHQIEKC